MNKLGKKNPELLKKKMLRRAKSAVEQAGDILRQAAEEVREVTGETFLYARLDLHASDLDDTLDEIVAILNGDPDAQSINESIEEDDGSKVMVDLRLFAQGDQWGAIAELEDGTEVPIWAVNGNDPDEIPPWETSEAEYERWYNLALDEAHDQGFVLEGELG